MATTSRELASVCADGTLRISLRADPSDPLDRLVWARRIVGLLGLGRRAEASEICLLAEESQATRARAIAEALRPIAGPALRITVELRPAPIAPAAHPSTDADPQPLVA